MSSFVRSGAVRVVPWLLSTSVACDVGTFSLGAGPEHEGSLVTGGASGSANGGAGGSDEGGAGSGATGGSAGNGGNAGAAQGGAGATGGGVTYGVLMRVSGRGPDTEGNGDSRSASITADGRFVVFESAATNLVPGDTNDVTDIFLFDHQTFALGRISTTPDGTQATDANLDPTVSGDGSRVAFSTWASNLYPLEFGFGQVLTGVESDLNAYPYELTPIVYPNATASSGASTLTSDGSRLVFVSANPDIVPDDTNGRQDFFVYDVPSGRTERVIMLDDALDLTIDTWRPRIGSDATYVAFSGGPLGELTNVYVVELATGDAELVGVTPDGTASADDCYDPSLSADGRLVAFVCDGDDIVAGDTNGVADVFVRDLERGVTERVSVASDGAQAEGASSTPALSGNGRRVVFQSTASNLGAGPELTTPYGALMSHDRVTGKTYRFTNATDSGADAPFEDPVLTPDGRFLTFESRASGLLGVPSRVTHVYFYEFLDI